MGAYSYVSVCELVTFISNVRLHVARIPFWLVDWCLITCILMSVHPSIRLPAVSIVKQADGRTDEHSLLKDSTRCINYLARTDT